MGSHERYRFPCSQSKVFFLVFQDIIGYSIRIGMFLLLCSLKRIGSHFLCWVRNTVHPAILEWYLLVLFKLTLFPSFSGCHVQLLVPLLDPAVVVSLIHCHLYANISCQLPQICTTLPRLIQALTESRS